MIDINPIMFVGLQTVIKLWYLAVMMPIFTYLIHLLASFFSKENFRRLSTPYLDGQRIVRLFCAGVKTPLKLWMQSPLMSSKILKATLVTCFQLNGHLITKKLQQVVLTKQLKFGGFLQRTAGKV